MKTFLLVVLFFSVSVLFIFKLLEIQDAEYKRHSDRAKENCSVNPEKTLVYDTELEYYKCVN